MDAPVLLCADGSDVSTAALAAAVALLPADTRYLVVTVRNELDPTLVTGTGMAGGLMSADEYDQEREAEAVAGAALLADVVAALGIDGAEVRLLEGSPGPRICELAEEVSAKAIAIGSRGHGGLKRAVLGSVSDHVVRNAPGIVMVSTASAE